MMVIYKIMYKPKEFKKRYINWNKTKHDPHGETIKTKTEAKKIVKTLDSLYADEFKYKKLR
jgi:hypothetical protein